MLGGRLTIEGVSVGLSERLAVSINKSIADIREPENRNADFTKTMKIPATPEVNALFEWAYDVNIDFQSFNPNKSTPGSYFLGTTEVMRGKIQLLAIPQVYNRGFYEIVIRGKNADIFIEMEGLFLTDLSFTDLNHTLTYANFSASPTIGVGYCYGYLDYGMNGVAGFNWNVLHFKAAIWIKEYIDRIFALLGRTYTSSIFTSTFFKSIAMPCNKPGMYQYSPTQIDNNQFWANKTTIQTYACTPTFYTGLSLWQFTTGLITSTIIFQDETTSPYNDPGAVYNNATGVFTTALSTVNSVNFKCFFTLIISSPPATSATFETSPSNVVQVRIYRNGVSVATQNVSVGVVSIAISGGTFTYASSVSVVYNAIASDPVGTIYEAKVMAGTIFGYFKNGTGTILIGGSPTANFQVDTGSNYYSLILNQNLYWGDTIDMNTVVPSDVKMRDFFSWIVRKFNLYLEIDKNNPLNYIIERRDDFFLTGSAPLDLNPLWDTSKEFTVLPMGELDAKTYLVRDKQDADYWNKLYQDKYKEVYGQQRVDVDNDFITGEKIIETGFSPTPGVAFQTDIVAPRFLQIDGSFPGGAYTVKPLKTNPRLLYWGGMKNCNLHGLIQSSTSGFVATSTYPSLNHIDDAQSPTVDLNFSSPIEVFYKKPGQVWTTNTQYNVGYKKFITEITDPNSKIVQMYAMLTQDQIYTFTFRRLVYWKGAKFYVNNFENDDIQSGGPTMLELLKLNPAQVVSIVQYNPYLPPVDQNRLSFTNVEFTERGNYGNYDNANVGRNLVNGTDIGLLVGENVQVDRAVKEFTGIGVKDKFISTEYEGMVVIRDDGMVISDDGVEKLKLARTDTHTANFTASKPIEIVDATAGNVDVILPDPLLLTSTKIVRVDNSGNNVTVIGPASETITGPGGSGASDTIAARTTKTYETNGTEYFY